MISNWRFPGAVGRDSRASCLSFRSPKCMLHEFGVARSSAAALAIPLPGDLGFVIDERDVEEVRVHRLTKPEGPGEHAVR